MAQRLKTLCKKINEELPQYVAKIEKVFYDTDSMWIGSRLRKEGKGRYGNELTIKEKSTGKLVYRHNSAETYRRNDEVVRWIEEELDLARAKKEIQEMSCNPFKSPCDDCSLGEKNKECGDCENNV